MIDSERLLMRVTPISPGEAANLCREMGDVLNSIQVQLREQGYDLGRNFGDNDLSYRLLQAWNHLFQARPMFSALTKQEGDLHGPPLYDMDDAGQPV